MATRPGELVPAPAADLCLNFANTRFWRGTATPTDELRGPDDLLRWTGSKRRLPPERAITMFAEAVGLREAIHRCFAATASGHAPDEADLAILNAALAETPARRCVRPGGWDIGHPELTTSVLLAPVLWSAADLLVGPQLGRVRQCSNPECGWLFLDNSKSGNRRWCSMTACGNRAKAHRHYLRQKEK